MISWLIGRQLDAEERKLGESMDYIRHVASVSLSAFLRFASVMPFANSRSALPAEAWFVAQVVALQHEDCGPCLQIGVNQARQAGVDAGLLRTVLGGEWDALPTDMCEVAEFTRAVVRATGTEAELRETLRERYGERGLIELSYAIASSRIPPTVKRALGFAQSCSAVPVQVREGVEA